MLCREIIKEIEKTYDRTYGMEGDNIGLLTGRTAKEVKHIYVAVDAVWETIQKAKEAGADMLLTHHPMIYGSLRQITDQTALGRNMLYLIEQGICCYALHTNYDVISMAEKASDRLGLIRREVLLPTGMKDGEEMGIGQVGEITEEITLEELVLKVKRAFGAEGIRTFGQPEKQIRKVAICPGSGRSALESALKKDADVLITGDIGHHDGLDSLEQGMAVMDAGHYGIEQIFLQDLTEELRGLFPDIQVTAEGQRSPFFVR